MIFKTNEYFLLHVVKLFWHQPLYYVYWLFKIINKKFTAYEIKDLNFSLWKRLSAFQIYPKDIAYYYRLYYSTKNLTWFYSLRKQRKIRRLTTLNYLKTFNVLPMKRVVTKHFKYNFYYHKILMHKFIFQKIKFYLYYKQYELKKFLKTQKLYNRLNSFLHKNKFLRMYSKYRIKEVKPLFHMYKHNLLRIFKESRQTHWTATHKETLNKRTYCNFLPVFMKKQSFYMKTALIFILQQVKITYSWKHSIILLNLFFFNYPEKYLDLKKGTILQFPKNGIIVNYKKLNKVQAFKHLWNQKRRQYLFIQSKKQLWMKKKKNFYKKIDYNFNQLTFLQNYYHYDVYTNSLCFFKNIEWHLLINSMSQFSFVLKLTKWRFKA